MNGSCCVQNANDGGHDSDCPRYATVKRDDITKLTAERDAMRAVVHLVESFAQTVERETKLREQSSRGGQHVTNTGDFASAQPSTMSRLQWWAREFRKLLAADDVERQPMKKADVEVLVANAIHDEGERIRKRALAMLGRQVTSRDDEYGRGWNDAVAMISMAFAMKARKPRTVGEAWVRNARREGAKGR